MQDWNQIMRRLQGCQEFHECLGCIWELDNWQWKVRMPVSLLQSLSVTERSFSFQDLLSSVILNLRGRQCCLLTNIMSQFFQPQWMKMEYAINIHQTNFSLFGGKRFGNETLPHPPFNPIINTHKEQLKKLLIYLLWHTLGSRIQV